jgi:(2S)-methylsuccinyl-CoA dehydrogenase
MATVAAHRIEPSSLIEDLTAAVGACREIKSAAIASLKQRIAPTGRPDADRLEREQHAAHGLAWLATYVEALDQVRAWAVDLDQHGALGERESLLVRVAFAEYLARLEGGIPMSQGEYVRPAGLGLGEETVELLQTPAIRRLVREGNTPAIRQRLAELIEEGDLGRAELDEEMTLIRQQFGRLADERVAPVAHEWHLKDELIPMELIEELAELGVFGLTVPEEHGGLGLGKVAMCVVTEELSRGYIGVGSLGTRSEIAAELIRLGGTDDQKARYLPRISSGEILPTAVFTEPDVGSDLASLKTRATLEGDVYRLTGAKTWITHAARADLMTVLCRTDPSQPGYKGLSILLAEKPRGTDADPFPIAGLTGGEIEVLGYRGMKEYTLGFDGFEVPKSGLLGGVEGQGFRQLMATFESARVQTAARAVGVARAAFEIGLKYAKERRQFGKPLFAFPRVSDKLAWMAVEITIARELTLFAARSKDADQRCDLEAGMAKLLAAQVAWSAADNALQIHGGNGYALEYPVSRILCDARILNIFEGAAEIQAHVIARRLLEG